MSIIQENKNIINHHYHFYSLFLSLYFIKPKVDLQVKQNDDGGFVIDNIIINDKYK